MPTSRSESTAHWRALLVLGRTSNLPTVWSNCLAGWLLAGGGPAARFCWLCLGATFLYLGGMFLNDAYDIEFDRQYRRERPIPSGVITLEEVWKWTLGWLGGGAFILILLGQTTALLAVILVGCIVLYDAIHKAITCSPVLMALCRFLLYLVAASAASNGVSGLAIWSALALGAYIIGLSYLARKESARGPLRYWPCYLLAMPVVLALLVNNGEYRKPGLLLSLILGLWILRCLRHVLGAGDRNVGRTVSGLLAGIVLVDLLAVVGSTPLISLVFVLLFLAALLFQRFVPAT